MKVSIIIPFYNVSKYIERSLLSALNQSYPTIEYVCVNDGSTDDSSQKILRIIENHPRREAVQLIEHKKNEGIASARNTGIAHSHGEYIYFLDSDDELPVDSIEKLVKINRNHADLIIGDFSVSGVSRKTFPPLEISDGYIEGNSEVFNLFLSQKWPDMTCNKLEKLSFIHSNQIKFRNGILHEDALWAFELAMNAQSMVVSHEITYIYHIRIDSITRKKSDLNFKSLIFILEIILDYARDKNLYASFPILIDYISDHCIYIYKELVKAKMGTSYIKEQKRTIRKKLKRIPLIRIIKDSSFQSKIKLLSYFIPSVIGNPLIKILLKKNSLLSQ